MFNLYILTHTEGVSRDKYIKQAGRFVCCDLCEYRLFRSSPLEPYLAMMILLHIDVLLPFQLLHLPTFQRYVFKFISEKIVITTPTDMYKASVWKIQAIIFQTLFFMIIGPHRYTRYQHAICNGEFWIHSAHKLRGTPREMYGMDSGEKWNDRVKRIIYKRTGKFNTPESMTQALQSAWIERYECREESTLLNTQKVSQVNHNAAFQRDMRLIGQTDVIRKFFFEQGVAGGVFQDMLLKYVAQSDLFDKLLNTPQGINPGENPSQHISVPDDEEYMASERVQFVSSFMDGGQTDQRDMRQQIKTVSEIRAVKVKSVQSGQYESVTVKADETTWRLLESKFVLQTKFRRIFNDQASWSEMYEIHWDPRNVYKYCLTFESDERVYIFIKYTQKPQVMTKRWSQRHNTNRFQPTDAGCLESQVCHPLRMHDSQPNAAGNTQKFSTSAIVVLSISRHFASIEDFQYTFDHHKYLWRHQQCVQTIFEQLTPQFEESEYEEIYDLHLQGRHPYLGDHRELVRRIENQLQCQSNGASRVCIHCRKQIHWYEFHDVCLSPSDSTRNFGSNMSMRLLDDIDIQEVEDPANEDYPINMKDPLQIIKENPLLWSTFLMRMFLSYIDRVLNIHSEEFFNCRSDSDWSKLNLRADTFINLVDETMSEVLVWLRGHSTSEDTFDLPDSGEIFRSLCGVYCIKRKDVEDAEDADSWQTHDSHWRCNMQEFVKVYVQTHQIADEIYEPKQFVDFFTDNYSEFLPNQDWSFWE